MKVTAGATLLAGSAPAVLLYYANIIQLLAMDILALVTMKNAAKCDT